MADGPPVVIRPHRVGDMGWIVHRQAILYAEEYGFDATYEALAAEIVAQFLRTFDPAREACFVAEQGGAIVGSVFCVRQSDEVAKLRLLYVEGQARGRGARATGYRRLTLWTNDILTAARRIYETAGFRLVAEERHTSFGKDLNGQTFELAL